jgi:CheY-like chemotaxis protein
MKNETAEVLLVEDNLDHAELIRTCLCATGVGETVVWMKDGRDALAYIRHTSRAPRLVLLDLQLPDIDGLEVLAQLKGERVLRAIPVLILTTSGHDRDIERAYELGANGYVVKPESFEELGAMLRDVAAYWLHRNRAPASSGVDARVSSGIGACQP